MKTSDLSKINLQFNETDNRQKLDNSYVNLVSRISKGEDIIGPLPLNIQIQTTSACNGKCAFCPYVGSWHHKNPGHMDDETFEKIVQGLKKFKILKLCPYLENEPLLDKKIFHRLDYMVKELKPMWVEFSSNLSILTDEMLLQIENLFPKIKHVFWISFHGVNKETYQEIMGLDYDRTMENIRKLVKLSQDLPIYLMINGSGEPILNDTLKTWFKEEEYYSFWEEQLKDYSKKPKIRFFNYHDRAGQIQLKEKNLSFNKIFRSSLQDFYCNRFDRWVHFLYSGEPILCCMDYNRETVIPLSENKIDVENIFKSPEFVQMIRKGCGMDESEDHFICKRCINPIG